MKKNIIVVFLAAVLIITISIVAFIGVSGNKKASSSFAVVNFQEIYIGSLPALAATERMETFEAAFLAQLQIISEKVIAAEGDEVMRAQISMEAQIFLQQAQLLMDQEKQAVSLRLTEELQNTLDTYRAENGYQAILASDHMASHAPEVNITDDILLLFNAAVIDFGPLPDFSMLGSEIIMPSIPEDVNP